jgi:gamma-glutamyltranspeptidase/glutathione hydrolase
MVCAAQPLAVLAGVETLRAGGSAVDAAIVTNACLGVVEPTANGLGGDLFALVWDPATSKLHGLNASGRAPLGLTIDRVTPEIDGTIPLRSPASWTVPGCADGWWELHRRFGALPFRDLFTAAAGYAEAGFPLSPVIAAVWARGAEALGDQPGFAEVFMPEGRPPAAGERFRNPSLARTLRLLAREGRDAFYRGPIAAAIVRASAAWGGWFAADDFERHRSTWDEPIATLYRGLTVWELPPNTQGLAALQMLNLLEGFDVAAMGRESADFWHVLIEAKKLAYADRAAFYADPEFAAPPVEALLSKEYAQRRREQIDLGRAAVADAPGEPAVLARGGTTYVCVADARGMMVSLIQSNYTGFGSGHVVPEIGFGLQNRGALFSLDPAHPNALAPGKRPFHTIIPAFATRDGAPWLAFGVMGGDMQPQGHVQIVMNLVDFGMNVQQAGDAPRMHHDGSTEPTGTLMHDGGILHVEEGIPSSVVSELARRGHRIAQADAGVFGGYQAIARDPENGFFCGGTERRKDGCALGY